VLLSLFKLGRSTRGSAMSELMSELPEVAWSAGTITASGFMSGLRNTVSTYKREYENARRGVRADSQQAGCAAPEPSKGINRQKSLHKYGSWDTSISGFHGEHGVKVAFA